MFLTLKMILFSHKHGEESTVDIILPNMRWIMEIWLLETQPQHVDLANEKAYIINTPEKNVPFVTVIAYLSNEGFHLENQGQFNAPFTEVPNLKNLATTGRILPDYTYSAHAAEVAVDEVTGQFEVTKIVAAFDVGRAITVSWAVTGNTWC